MENGAKMATQQEESPKIPEIPDFPMQIHARAC